MDNKDILIAKITRFLKERNAYDSFVLNLKGGNFESLGSLVEYETMWVSPQMVINDAFNWEDTPEGEVYWNKLHMEFYDDYDNLPIEQLERDDTWTNMWEE